MRNYQYGSAINKGVNCTKIELSQQYFPNENIYKMDSEYTMKPTLSFVNSREQICKRNILLRYIDLIKIMIAYACVKNVYLIFEEWGEISILLTFLRIPVIFILLITGLMVINIDKFINNTSYVRIFLEFEILLNILIEMKKDKTCYDHSSYSFILILMKYIKGFIYNFCFCLTTDESLISYSIESIVILSFIGDQNRFFLSRLITNLCSMKLIYTVIHVFITLGIQSQLVLGQRELWAMYDSFKRSYNTIKTIYDEFGIPVFIVKKNGLRIYYRNTEADKLLRKRSTKIGFNQPTRLTSRRTGLKHDITLKDVFDKSDLLEYEISKCLKRGLKQFDFPINTRNKDLLLQETENCPTMYEGDVECVDWVKVHLCECQWKENEALMVI